ncbi:MAG: hypothetical protein IJ530_03680 [Treponema sp.]|uniref:hypothetical protein n=1 Tax=Treponema sp. TaxID=166 RepID=UPI0025CC64A4|nr:hypothetical protein [Treponema sp.]MBQ8678844.1 hypothetical protein [Treponema sp.]
MSNFVPEKSIRDFFALLNENEIHYLLIKNICGELPGKLKGGKDLDILVHPDEITRFAKLMSENGFFYRIHPFGTEHGWKFAYGLEKHQFWQKKNSPKVFYIDVCFCLCVKSLTPKTWVPLDEKLNSRIWENQVWDNELSCPCLDEKTLFVYLFARSVFDKRGFSEKYIAEIEKRKDLIDDTEIRDLLSCIFYNFTDQLIQLAKNGKYGEIFSKFLTFKDY